MQLGNLAQILIRRWKLEHKTFVLRGRIATDFVIQRNRADIKKNGLADSLAEMLVHPVFEIYLFVCCRDAPGDVEAGRDFALENAAAELRERCGSSGVVSRGEGVERAPYDCIIKLAIRVEGAVGEKPHQGVVRIKSADGTVVFKFEGELVEEGAQERLHCPGGFMEVDVLAQVVAGKQEFLRGG